MQRLLKLRQASNFRGTPTNASTFSNAFTTFNTKPTIQNPLFSSFSRHSCHTKLSWTSHHTLSLKAHTFLFNLLRLQRSFLCFSSAQLRKCLLKYKVFFFRAQLPNRSFQFTSSSRSSRRRSWFQRLSGDDVVLGLIITNVAVFYLWKIADQSFMEKNFTVGDILGPGYLVKLYLAGAIGGSVLHLVHHAFLALRSKGQVMWKDPSRTPALGAIGAVNALIWLYIFPILEAAIYLEFSSIPVRVMLLGAFLIGKDMLLIINGNGNISGAAYLGGVLVGALACARIRKGHF
ncbi:RHOMBOID-like protein 12, mitochondrial isoform X2 [Mangifera indica]|uniref:RHOMBOID-like protein 12, mitochondrial isoform X2 n=1 Tax=Mangifera indica TaxID=29780 RepID=UPI001CF9DDF1|nr:RHOMBOID-like protein 12, mitochondrial isoform X2 [Mangifera indica]